MSTVAMPLADEWTDDYALLVIDHSQVVYSRPMRHFFSDCRAAGRRPVLITTPHARLSAHLIAAMAASAAHWAIRDASGVFDARSGLRITSIPELWTGPRTAERHAPINPPTSVVPVLTVDIYAGDRATDDTVIGPLADYAVSSLGGGQLIRSGADEPLASPWNHAEVTRRAQEQMPVSDPVLASSAQGAWVSLTTGRTRTGLIEHVRGGIPLAVLADSDPTHWRDAVMPMITDSLSGLVDEFRPRVALISSTVAHYDGSRIDHRAGARAIDAPLAVLIGPRGVRDLDLDLADLAQRHDIVSLGPGRVPSALVRMTGPDPLWHQLRAFAFDLDQQRLAAALGGDA